MRGGIVGAFRKESAVFTGERDRATTKILALLVSVLLVLSMTSAFAATVTIEGQTSDGVINGHTFKAYKVLNGNWEGGVLTNITNGTGVSWSNDMVNALNAISGISDVEDGETFAKALEGANDTVCKAVALVLKDNIVSANAIELTGDDAVTSLADGYYVIIDHTNIGADEVLNATLLQVAGDNVRIQVKTSTTTIDKKIDGDNDVDSEANPGLIESNDGQVGDLVPYVITATIADTTYYDHYYFEMNDTLSDGLDISGKTGTDAFSDYKVYDNDDVITTGFDLTVDTAARTIKLTIADAKSLGGHVIKLTYNAKINENAVSGVAGNPNKVTLKYSNNPDHSGEEEYDDDDYTTVTPEEFVKTFTTGIQLLKVDKDDPSKVLEGAVFTIDGPRGLKTVKTVKGYVQDDEHGTYYKLAGKDEYTTTQPGTNDELPDSAYESTEHKYKQDNITTIETEEGTTLVSGTTGIDGLLTFDKLGEGTYTIHEVTAPTGYNKLDADIVFTLHCDDPETVTENTECEWTVDGISGAENVTFDESEGLFKITVKNGSGTQLPSTGGIGTTIFYVAGSILVLAAAILLITKRRMSAND